MVTRVIQGSSEDAVKLGDKFISEGMPNSLAWGLVCSLITGTKTDATAIRTVLSQQEEDHYAVLRAKRETKGSETAAAAAEPPKAAELPKADVKPAATTAAPVTEPAPAAAPAAPAPAESAQEKPVISPATDHLDAEPVAAPKATETTAATATPVASGSPAAEGEGPKDPKPAAPTNSVTNSVLVGPNDHL